MDTAIQTTKPKRHYHRITSEQMAQFQALQAVLGNGSSAVRVITPAHKNPGDRAFQIRKKSEHISTEQFIDDQLQQIGVDAINRLGELIESNDEKVALGSIRYAIDHIRGQATKKSIAITGKLNIQNVLD